MDHDRFDDLTRALATTTTRRQFLKTLAGGVAGGLLAFLGVGEAAANDNDNDDCKRNGKKCKKNKQCCSGNCQDGRCAAACSPGQVRLSNGTCVTPCGGGCDATHCACGICYCLRNLCGAGETATTCSSDTDCPRGQFCNPGDGHCAAVTC